MGSDFTSLEAPLNFFTDVPTLSKVLGKTKDFCLSTVALLLDGVTGEPNEVSATGCSVEEPGNCFCIAVGLLIGVDFFTGFLDIGKGSTYCTPFLGEGNADLSTPGCFSLKGIAPAGKIEDGKLVWSPSGTCGTLFDFSDTLNLLEVANSLFIHSCAHLISLSTKTMSFCFSAWSISIFQSLFPLKVFKWTTTYRAILALVIATFSRRQSFKNLHKNFLWSKIHCLGYEFPDFCRSTFKNTLFSQ